MKISITGSRNLEGHKELVYSWLDTVLQDYSISNVHYLKSGGAVGWDMYCQKYFAEKFGLSTKKGTIEIIEPKYNLYAKSMRWKAPLDRNGDIVKDTDYCIAGFNGANRNKGGTMDAAKKAFNLGIPVIFIDIPKNKIEFWTKESLWMT